MKNQGIIFELSCKYQCLRTHDELFLLESDLVDFGPGECDRGRQLVVYFVEVDAQGVDAKQDLCAFSVLEAVGFGLLG